VYHGKVRDVYKIDNGPIVMIATDRISAFDVILPRAIPYKGQVLNQIAAYFLEKTADIVPNWLEFVPDPNVSIGVSAEPVKIELIVRGYLVGSAWRDYAAGSREICGIPLPQSMKEYDAFPAPSLTPSTKADEGHDENISAEALVEKGLATATEWEQLSSYALQLFARGQEMAKAQGLILADTKYEFGRFGGKIILIDEIHTPDSSRYFLADSYRAYSGGTSADAPKQLSKEFVRTWLIDNGFDIHTGEGVPDMTDEFVDSVTERYVELYETLTGKQFERVDTTDIAGRIESNITKALQEQGK
jgi:phosphoribosylaminoimidazole-succinocarboxamide synthase